MYGIINHAFNMLKLYWPPLHDQLPQPTNHTPMYILNLYQYLGVKHVCTPVAPVIIV